MQSRNPKVTAIEKQGRGRVGVSLDGLPALTVASEVAAEKGLRVGMGLSSQQVAELVRADELYRAHQAAVRYLGYRPRSEKEVRDRLRRGRFASTAIAEVMARLKGLGLVDDAAFARFWKEGRESSRPRGRRLLKQELRRKGVEGEVIAEAVQDVDEEEGAYRAASKKARTLHGLDERAFFRRLSQFLQRRGYGYDLVRRTVERLWQEQVDKS
ncbi:MAG: RecX family transcriptional regulator [Chloroflexota bacterium]